ncbi:hypothetical protein F0562_018209 [Nyssa sinensis]|uniref:Fe2OG dioxygenase domain-containing protein n=1 Tax=Nyssa sinensis TaxID=561372 RepID=A0A5J4ZBB1_9ASTE|nr:hypothetical protein F0562_018209 [Nyssa sinensis]
MASSQIQGSFESSLSIQELAKAPILAIPQRYVQEDQEPSILASGTSLPTIPFIDMKCLIPGEAKDYELEKLHSTCKEWGIFQLVNHGVSSSLVEKLKYEIEEFYNLPLEEKMRYKLRPGDVEGYGQTMLNSQAQKVEWADRDTLESYFSELQKIAMTLLGLMGKALKIEKREVEEMFEDGMQSVRITYYPPCPQPELAVGLRPHSDATGITILLQVNSVEGFEVKKDGVWIPVNILPEAFVVNVGDIMEILSNGVYKSIEHRAVVNRVKERISLAMFFNPKFQAEVGPAGSLINPQNPPLFKRVGMEKYVKDFFTHKLKGKSFIEQMRIKIGEDSPT